MKKKWFEETPSNKLNNLLLTIKKIKNEIENSQRAKLRKQSCR